MKNLFVLWETASWRKSFNSSKNQSIILLVLTQHLICPTLTNSHVSSVMFCPPVQLRDLSNFLTWRVTMLKNYHRACWVSCANIVLKIVAVNLTTMPATREEDITACNLISESWILWQNTFLCRTLFKPDWRTGSFMLPECHLVLWLCSTPICLLLCIYFPMEHAHKFPIGRASKGVDGQKAFWHQMVSPSYSALKALLTGYWNIQAAGYSSFTKLEDRLHDDIVAWHLETLWCM